MIKVLDASYDFTIKRMRLIAARSVGQDVEELIDASAVLAEDRYLNTYLNPASDCYYCYGMLDDASGALESVVSIRLEPQRQRWLLQWLCSDSRLDNGKPLNGVFELVDHVIRLNEAEGMTSWLGCIPAKYEGVYDRLWRRHCLAYAGYEVSAKVLVPADTVADSSEHFDDLFGHTTQSIDMLVRTHTRRSQPD